MADPRSQRFADETTLHAVKHYFYGNVMGKVFWGILAVVALSSLCLQLEKVVNKFIDQETGATMSEFKPSTMPAVYICPDAWINSTKADVYSVTETGASIINGFFPIAGFKQLFLLEGPGMKEALNQAIAIYGKEYTESILPLWKTYAEGNISNLVNLLAVDELHTTMATVLPSDKAMTQDRVTTWNGVCYRFESDMEVNEIQSMFAGITIYFHLSEDVVVPKIVLEDDFENTNASNTVENKTSQKSGSEEKSTFRIVLGSTGELNIASSSEISFMYGSHYVVLYSVTTVKRVSTRKWPCIKYYSVGDQMTCTHKHGNSVVKPSISLLGLNGCHTALPASNNHSEALVDLPCNSFVDVLGSVALHYSNLTISTHEWNKICPRPCEYASYDYAYQLKDDEFTEGGRHAKTMIEVKAAQGMSGLEIKEYLVLDTIGMLSNVGGTLGLWLGASVLSLIEIFYLLCLEKYMTGKNKDRVAHGTKG